MRNLFLLVYMMLAAGCATVDFDAPKSVSHAIVDTQDTALGKGLAKYADKPAHLSGFHVITDGLDALAIRLLLANWAEASIDAQYYMIDNDVIGKVFFTSLLRAADRDVRVRLLIDDINTGGMEHKLAALSEHPNIELRLFNPFANRGARVLDAWDLARLNRRMHNKSFTVDNQVTLIGGRNIADEYFSANRQYNFGDLDTLAVGPVVRETSAMFDAYWNHESAIPYEQLRPRGAAEPPQLPAIREGLEEHVDALRDTPYSAAVRESLEEFLDDEDKRFIWAPYELVFDSPEKSLGEDLEADEQIITPMGEVIRGAERSMLIVSPYFVLPDASLEGVDDIREDGVRIEVVTNSLASSDHILVQGAYAPTRRPLLEAGVVLCEVRADVHLDGTDEADASDSISSLHTKAFVVDERYFYMGSFNWDPRSRDINTELGIIIDSPEIAKPLVERYRARADEVCYWPFLDDRQRLRWRVKRSGKMVIEDTEPDTTYGQRLKMRLSRFLPIKSQL